MPGTTRHLLRNGYRRLFRHQEDARAREAVEALHEVSLFRGFSRSELHELADLMHHRRYKRDEYLYYEHDPGLGLYIVRSGRVRLTVEDDAGGVHELRQAAEFDFFGDLSLLGDFRRMETAQAMTETDVLGFFSPDLKIMLKRSPATGALVMRALAHHLAAQQVELMRLLSEGGGKAGALRTLARARLKAGR